MKDESIEAEQNMEGTASPNYDERAAVFIDYHNLHVLLTRELAGAAHPADYVKAMLEELQHYLIDQDYKQTAIINAYADFSQLRGDGQSIQRSLYLLGAESHFVPSTIQKNASEIQLCIDAMNVLHSRPDIRSFVLLTGNRPYLPLVQQFKRSGRDSFVAALRPPPQDGLSAEEDDFFFDARNLLPSDLRRQLKEGAQQQSRFAHRAPQTREDAEYERVTESQSLRTLEVIEEYFGQYDEVYLTPLLRKLSELLGEAADPKSIISRLEAASAIWLEKRRGSPHDYTVLLVDEEHPDVQEVHAEFYGAASEQANDEASYGAFSDSNYAAEYGRFDRESSASASASPPSSPSQPDASEEPPSTSEPQG